MVTVMKEVLSSITASAIHVSFDVDVMDETVFPATGYRMPKGLTLLDIETALAACFESGNVVSLDLVEYNPLLDTDGDNRQTLLSLVKRAIR
jgi:arginase family enzyme